MTGNDPWANLRHSVEQRSEHGRLLKFYVPATELARREEQLLRQRAARLRLPGFRPGRVPPQLARQHLGKALREEVLETVGRAALGSVLSRIDPGQLVAPPTLTPPALTAPGEDLEFVAEYELWPQLTAPDTAGLAVEHCVAVVAEEDVERQLLSLRRQRAEYSDVARPPRDGDWLQLDYRLERASGEQLLSREGLELPFGASEQAAHSLPAELLTALADSAPGASGEFSMRLPDDHMQAELRGVELRGHYHLHKVRTPQLPELDEAFCAAFGIAEGGQKALRAELRRSLESAAENAAQQRQRQQLFDALLERAKTPEQLPEQLLRGEIDTMRSELARRGRRPTADGEELPDTLFEAAAQRRVRLGLVLGSLIERFALKVDEAEVRTALEGELARQPPEQREQLLHWYRDNPRALRGVEQSILEGKVVTHLLAEATVTERSLSLTELLGNAQEQAA